MPQLVRLPYLMNVRRGGGGAAPSPITLAATGSLTDADSAFARATPFGFGVSYEGTTSTNAAIPNEQLAYITSWGDFVGQTYAYSNASNASKEVDYGRRAACVFLTSGVKSVTCRVVDSTAATSSTTLSVTAVSGDAQYPTTNTICVSPTGSTTGAPAGATIITGTNWNAQMGAGKRVLLSRGETGYGVGTFNVSNAQLGAYGTGARPKISANSNMISMGSSSAQMANTAMYGIEIDGASGASSQGISFDGTFKRQAFYDMNVHHCVNSNIIGSYTALDFNNASAGGTLELWNEVYFSECLVKDCVGGVADYCMYFTCYKSFLLGCDIGPSNGHCIRMPSNSEGAIAHCTVGAATGGSHQLKFAAPTFGRRILRYKTQTLNFTVTGSSTVTGLTSGATATLINDVDSGTTGWLYLIGVTGTFQNNELITNSAGGAATANGAQFASAANWFSDYSENTCIYDCIFNGNVGGGTHNIMVQLAPQNTTEDERLRKLEVSRNKWNFTSICVFGIQITGDDIWAANCVMDATSGQSGSVTYVSVVTTTSVPAVARVKVHNSTFNRSSPTAGEHTGVSIGSGCSSCEVKNCIDYHPSATAPIVFLSDSGTSTSALTNSSNANVTGLDPVFVSATPSAWSDYALTAGSPAAYKTGGTDIKNLVDAAVNSRAGATYGVGAFQLGGSPF